MQPFEGVPIDWGYVILVSERGLLDALLKNLPRERWAECNQGEVTFLHHALRGPNVDAVALLLQSKVVDVNARTVWGGTPVDFAVAYNQSRALELLCAAGANIRSHSSSIQLPIDDALIRFPDSAAVLQVLLANGVRLSTANKRTQDCITSNMREFERGVLRCRVAVVALLRVKKAGSLWRWDKFLLKEIAYSVWSTRCGYEWGV